MRSFAAAVFAYGAAALGCPDYADIRQASVSPEAGFSMKKLEGAWNILATSEPTIPAMCRQCGVINFTIYEKDYVYRTTSSCQGPLGPRVNTTVPFKGHLGGLSEQGNCMENFDLFNHTWDASLVPNMFFNYTDDWYMSYACGVELGVMKIRSFFLATRNPAGKTRAWIDEKIEWAKALGLLEGWENIAITDEGFLHSTCWSSSVAQSVLV